MKRTLAFALVLVACGGSHKPADNPSENEGDGGSSSSETPASSDSASPASSSATDSAPAADSAAPAASAAPTPPPAPAFSDSDCGKCLNTKCAKPLTTCQNDATCTTGVATEQSCTGSPTSCIGSGSVTGAKPTRLLNAYNKCATKASAGKACKSVCGQ